jgi:hypothetical protein
MSEIKMYSLPTTVAVAILVIGGNYGNGSDRIKRLKEDGFDPVKVQKCVNDLLPIITRYR